MSKHQVARSTTILSILAVTSSGSAGPTWCENVDAGSVARDAQTTVGEGEMTKIEGSLGAVSAGPDRDDFEDVYLIRVDEPGLFAACTEIFCEGSASFDTMLWMLRAPGDDPFNALGLLANDDAAERTDLSLLPNMATDATGFTLTEPGLYLLAISHFPRVPISDTGAIFDVADPTEVSGADGPGAGDPHVDWEGAAPPGPGTYGIAMTGVCFAGVSAFGFENLPIGPCVLTLVNRELVVTAEGKQGEDCGVLMILDDAVSACASFAPQPVPKSFDFLRFIGRGEVDGNENGLISSARLDDVPVGWRVSSVFPDISPVDVFLAVYLDGVLVDTFGPYAEGPVATIFDPVAWPESACVSTDPIGTTITWATPLMIEPDPPGPPGPPPVAGDEIRIIAAPAPTAGPPSEVGPLIRMATRGDGFPQFVIDGETAVPQTQPCSGDVDGDTEVNVQDLLAVITNWGSCPGCPADVTGDRVVDVQDLVVVITGWGSCPEA